MDRWLRLNRNSPVIFSSEIRRLACKLQFLIGTHVLISSWRRKGFFTPLINHLIFTGCYISFYHHLPIPGKWGTNLIEKHLPKWNCYLSPKEKELFFVLKVYVHSALLSLPSSGNCYFLVLSECLPESDFYLPRPSAYCTSWNFRGGFIFANFASQSLAKISTSIYVNLF